MAVQGELFQRGKTLAVVILGGLFSSTALNLLVMPSLYLRFGRPLAAKLFEA